MLKERLLVSDESMGLGSRRLVTRKGLFGTRMGGQGLGSALYFEDIFCLPRSDLGVSR